MTTLDQAIDKIRDIIIKEYQPDKIILFGSRARGDAKPDSDIDILVVSDREKDLPRYQRGLQLRLKLASVRVPKDVLMGISKNSPLVSFYLLSAHKGSRQEGHFPRVFRAALIYTHEDFGKWRTVRQSLVSTVLREGVVLYER